MKTFKTLQESIDIYLPDLSESLSVSDGSHYTHIEDELFISGSKAIPKIMVSLVDTFKGIPQTAAQTKIDGSPSLIYGFDKNGKFFVTTKSIFNKNPKVSYTDEDIENNHGHAPGLVAKMKLGLKYLPSITATKGVFLQGDVMFSPKDLEKKDIDGVPHYVFQPNTVVNAIPVDSDMGRKIAAAKFGFAPHTKYDQAGNRSSITASDVRQSTTVFLMPISVPKISDYTGLQSGVDKLRKTLEATDRAGLSFVSSSDMSALMLAVANFAVKTKEKVSYPLLLTYVHGKFDKEISAVKTDATKDKKKANRDALLNEIAQNKAGIESVLASHRAIAEFKDEMISELDRHQPIKRFFKGELGKLHVTAPEGYVAINQHGTSKFVNRSVFSLQNFMQNSRGPVRESISKDRVAVIVPLARFNPPHKEHLNLIHAVIKKANDLGGTPIIFVSTTVDQDKNPLTVAEKIKYLTKMSGAKVPNLFRPAPNMFEAIKSLNGKFDRVVFVLGDDRVSDVKRIEAYNGKDYSFKSIQTVSRHSIINTRSGGGDGVHASDIRRWSKEGDFDSVRAAMPKTLSDLDVKTMMASISKRHK